jgi:hypothetical protein
MARSSLIYRNWKTILQGGFFGEFRATRHTACFPAGAFRVDKYWPPVNRVDNVYGDRHLACSCPPMEVYVKAAE